MTCVLIENRDTRIMTFALLPFRTYRRNIEKFVSRSMKYKHLRKPISLQTLANEAEHQRGRRPATIQSYLLLSLLPRKA